MDNERTEYGIGDLSRLCNVSFRTLRFYEDKNLLRPRREGLRRIYTTSDRVRLEIIILAKRLGFSLASISDLLAARKAWQEGTSTSYSVEALGLTGPQIIDQIEQLSRELARVEEAIEELRATAPRPDDNRSKGEPAPL